MICNGLYIRFCLTTHFDHTINNRNYILLNCVQKFIDSQQPVNPLVVAKQREMALDKVLQKEKEIMNIGIELSNVVNAPTSNEADTNDWFVKQSELEYKLVQKEDELNETINGLNEATSFENKIETLQIDNNNPEYFAITARINAKENEHLENEKRLRQKNAEIEEKRKAARELQKRHLQVSHQLLSSNLIWLFLL